MDELEPDYILILPRDPFNGKSMKYRVTDDSAVIYSMGPNEKDDAGAAFDAENNKGDVSFQLKQYE
ncbi:MAG: hypothetical protein N2C14_02030 [Planctomycetales bacterium]